MARQPRSDRQSSASASRTSIRMYRLSVGDCFLITLRRDGDEPFRILIDCGIHQSQSGGSKMIRRAVENLYEETDGKIDILIITHEHADHISGFRIASKTFQKFTFGVTWFAWTEDNDDPLAKEVAGARYAALDTLVKALSRKRVSGEEDPDGALLESLMGFWEPAQLAGAGSMGFYGGGGGPQSQQSLRTLIGATTKFEYKQPGMAPFEIPGADARIFVLGPPRDVDLLEKSNPTAGTDQVYHFGAFDAELQSLNFLHSSGPDCPFEPSASIPLEATRSIGFFQRHYWSDAAPEGDERECVTQGWRRIDRAWMGGVSQLALKLDEDTNNTSLVVAIELSKPEEDGPVLLFAGDAQVGNWLSWKDVVWENYEGRRITGPDLLRRTIVYKVGHHGSHNATLRENGLEIMDSLQLALLPTDRAMAEKVKWGRFPLPELVERLEEKTKHRVVRSDGALPSNAEGFAIQEDPLYFEVSF